LRVRALLDASGSPSVGLAPPTLQKGAARPGLGGLLAWRL